MRRMKKLLSLLFGMSLSMGSILHAADANFEQEEAKVFSKVASGINKLAFDLYPALGAKDGNVTFSPMSISLALSMVYAGAQSATEQAMKDSLHFGENTLNFHKSMGNFMEILSKRTGGDTTLNIANDVWLQNDFAVLDQYTHTIGMGYAAKPMQLNFKNLPGPSTQTINQKISHQTNGEIPKLFKEDLDKATRLVLTNAMFFKANWRSAFRGFRTFEGEFAKMDGLTAQVNYMNQTSHLMYGEDEHKQFVVMPYRDEEFAALFVLPREGSLSKVSSDMSEADFNAMLNSVSDHNVRLKLPKFTQRMSPDMKDALSAKGLGILFDERTADLSGINGIKSGEDKLFVSTVMHEAVVKMYEEGTTAAAATGIGIVGTTSIMEPELAIDFLAERPFFFYIFHKPTNAILFMGRVAEPMAS